MKFIKNPRQKWRLIALISMLACCDRAFAASLEDEMQAALEEATANQQMYDKNLHNTSQQAYEEILYSIDLDRNNLIYSLQKKISDEIHKGNVSIAADLKEMLAEILGGTDLFSESYVSNVPSTTTNTAADQAAIQNVLCRYEKDLIAVQQQIDEYNRLLNQQNADSIGYLNRNPAAFSKKYNLLPDAPDGTPAVIFAIDQGCYYINAGRYSNVGVGAQYAIVNAAGDNIGLLRIIKCADIYAAGVLVRSLDIPVNSMIAGILTRRKPIPI